MVLILRIVRMGEKKMVKCKICNRPMPNQLYPIEDCTLNINYHICSHCIVVINTTIDFIENQTDLTEN